MSNLKVLPCPFKRYLGDHEWYKERNRNLDEELSNYYKQVAPRVGSDGWFYKGGDCWYEFEGSAYLAKPRDFLYSLELINAGEFDTRQYRLLNELDKVDSKLVTKEQRRFLFFYKQHLAFKTNKAKSLVRIKEVKARAKLRSGGVL